LEIKTTQVKTKDRHIWGWLSAITGGLLIFLGLYLTIDGIFSSPSDWYQIFLIFTLPALFLAVPLLIYGIRRIKHVHGNEEINAGKINIELVDTLSTDVEPAVVGSVDIEPIDVETITRKNKKQQVLGWVAAILGGSLIYIGYFALMMEIFTGDSSDWYIIILAVTVPSFLLGIPLLLLGIRKLKNVGENENSENKAKEHTLELVMSWVAALMGGLFTLAVIDSLFLSIFSGSPEGNSGLLKCAVPGILFGVFLLIVGIRRLYKVEESERMLAVDRVGTKSKRRIWGWILTIIGVLIILSSIGLFIFFDYVLFILSPLKGIVEPYAGSNLLSMISLVLWFVLPLFLLGCSLLILGLIRLKEKELGRRSRGLLLNIMGAVYILFSIFGILIAEMINANDSGKGASIVFWSPILLLGILAVVFGIRDITYVEKLPPENPGNVDKPQSEVEPG
jgi:hypothetical protein